MRFKALCLVAVVSLTGCSQKLPGARPDSVRVALAPDVVSSQDGTLHVTATVLEHNTPLRGFPVALTVDYIDRSGTPRMISGTSGDTSLNGALDFTVTGLSWEGTGTITATVLDATGAPRLSQGAPVTATASFSVLDLSPPQLTILPPTANLKVGRGLPVDVQVTVTDEIGISQIFFEASSPDVFSQQSTLIASGTTSATVVFSFDVPDFAIGNSTITLNAMAADLSNNLTASAPLQLTIDPAVRIAVPPGLVATQLTTNGLSNPTAIAISPKDGMLYVADASGGGTCGGGCVRQVNPATGAITTTAIVALSGLSGISFDATGDNMYLSRDQNALLHSVFGGATYAAPTVCNIVANQNPQMPRHQVVDATLGLLVTDQNDQNLKREALPCAAADPVNFSSQGSINSPWGVARIPGGPFLVSDDQDNRILSVDATSGAVTTYEFPSTNQRIDNPLGIDWLAGGASSFDNSLFVASCNNRRIMATQGNYSARPAAFLADSPIDVAFDPASAGTLYILSGNVCNGGSNLIFKVTGY